MGIGTHLGIVAQSGGGVLFDKYSWTFDGTDEFFVNQNTFDSIPEDRNYGSLSTVKWSTSLWIKPDSLPGNRYIYYTTDSSNALVTYLLVKSTGQLQAFIGGSSSNYTRFNNFSLSTGNWYNVVVTYNGALNRYLKLRIFVNGTISSGGSNFFAANNFESTEIRLGNNYDENAEFPGHINEFAVWKNHTLGQSEVDSIYNSGVANDLTTLSTPPTNFFRSETAVYGGTNWEMTDVMGTGKILQSTNMDTSNKTTDVPS
tara:strand:+ start:2329 stop:3102 length:774 start_codon:yes stop_codon:yes gene_type:complete